MTCNLVDDVSSECSIQRRYLKVGHLKSPLGGALIVTRIPLQTAIAVDDNHTFVGDDDARITDKALVEFFRQTLDAVYHIHILYPGQLNTLRSILITHSDVN